MKKVNFLNKLKKERKLELVEPSEEMKSSYLQKAESCLKAARILLQNQLYENSVSEAYYCMYNSLLALLFKIGIKSENHSASIILLKNLFNEKDLFKIISFAKTERIDKQYYIESQQVVKVTEDSCRDMILKAEDFLIKIKLLINNLNLDYIDSLRNKFKNLISD